MSEYVIDHNPYYLGKDKYGKKHDVRDVHPILIKLIMNKISFNIINYLLFILFKYMFIHINLFLTNNSKRINNWLSIKYVVNFN